MPFLTHGSYRIRYELDGPADAPAYVLVNGLTQYAELWARLSRRLDRASTSASRRSICSARAHPTSPSSSSAQDDQVAALALLIGELGDGPGLSRRHQLRRPDRAALCHRAWQAAVRTGADELLCGAIAATPPDRQRPAHRPDPRRHQLSAGSAAADERLRSMAEASAGQARQREAAGLAGQ